MRRSVHLSPRAPKTKQFPVDEKLPFTSWELEVMSLALRNEAEKPGYGSLPREQMRDLSTRLQRANIPTVPTSKTKGTMKNLKTIEDMEAMSKNEDDGASYKNIRGEWLEVMNLGNRFTYRWGKNEVTRDVAANIIKTA